MKLKWTAPLALFALGLTIKRNPGQRETRTGAIEEPSAADAFSRLNDLPQFRLMRRLITRRLTEGRSWRRALDVGSGPGRLAVDLARLVPDLQVVGIDPSIRMVELATENAQKLGLGDRVSFREGTAESVPFPDSSFDLLVSTLSLHHWSDPVAGLREIGRVIEPRGRFMIFDTRRDAAILAWLFIWVIQHLVLPGALRRVGEPLGSIRAAHTPEEVAQLARQAGLRGWHVIQGPFWLILESAE